MQRAMTLEPSAPMVREIAAAAFPSYKGRKFRLRVAETAHISHTYWDGGSRYSYAAVDLSTLRAVALPQWDPPQFGGPSEIPPFPLIHEGRPVCLVEHSIFCGKDLGLTFYIHPQNSAKLLPAGAGEISERLEAVLECFRAYKSYARPQYLSEMDATTEELEALVAGGFLKCQRGKSPRRLEKHGLHSHSSGSWVGFNYDLARAQVTTKGKNASAA